MTLQGVASPPLPIGCGQQLLRMHRSAMGHSGTVPDVLRMSSLTARCSTKLQDQQRGTAIAIPSAPRREPGAVGPTITENSKADSSSTCFRHDSGGEYLKRCRISGSVPLARPSETNGNEKEEETTELPRYVPCASFGTDV